MRNDGGSPWDGGREMRAAGDAQLPLFDIELGRIFLNMRTLQGVSLWDMAHAFGSEPTVIADLEAGALSTLPSWPELSRLVHAYARLSGIDPNPILLRLQRSLTLSPGPATLSNSVPQVSHRTIVPNPAPYPDPYASHETAGRDAYAEQAAAPSPAVQRMPIPSRNAPTAGSTTIVPSSKAPDASARQNAQMTHGKMPAAATAHAKLKRSARSIGRGASRVLKRRAWGIGLLGLLPALILTAAQLVPGTLYSLVKPLPTLAATPLRHGIDRLVVFVSPVRDGLTWIELDDPRDRKNDKLHQLKR